MGAVEGDVGDVGTSIGRFAVGIYLSMVVIRPGNGYPVLLYLAPMVMLFLPLACIVIVCAPA